MISMKKMAQIKAAQDEAKARQAALLEKYGKPLKRTAAQRLASRPDFPDLSTPPYHGPKLKSEGSI
jgi:hypothetical protein